MKFGTDGVRGVANTDLTASFALDARPRRGAGARRSARPSSAATPALSTAMLEAAFVAGLASEGVVVHRLGVVPTPVGRVRGRPPGRAGRGDLGLAQPVPRQRHQAVRPGGTKLPDEVEARIEAEVLALPAPTGEPAQLVDVEDSPAYRQHVLDALAGP